MGLALYLSFVSCKPQRWQTVLLASSRVLTNRTQILFGASLYLAKNLFFPSSCTIDYMAKVLSMRSKWKSLGGAAGKPIKGLTQLENFFSWHQYFCLKLSCKAGVLAAILSIYEQGPSPYCGGR